MAGLIPTDQRDEMLDWDVDTGEFDADEKMLLKVMTAAHVERDSHQAPKKKTVNKFLVSEDINMEGVQPVEYMGQSGEVDEEELEEESAEGAPKRRSRDYRRHSSSERQKTSPAAPDTSVHGAFGKQAVQKRARIQFTEESPSQVPKPRSRSSSPSKREPSSRDSDLTKPVIVREPKSVDASGKEIPERLVITLPLLDQSAPGSKKDPSMQNTSVTFESAAAYFTQEGTENYLNLLQKNLENLLKKDKPPKKDRDDKRKQEYPRTSASDPSKAGNDAMRTERPADVNNRSRNTELPVRRSIGDPVIHSNGQSHPEGNNRAAAMRSISLEDRRGALRNGPANFHMNGVRDNTETGKNRNCTNLRNSRPPKPTTSSSTFLKSYVGKNTERVNQQISERVKVQSIEDKYAISTDDVLRHTVSYFDAEPVSRSKPPSPPVSVAENPRPKRKSDTALGAEERSSASFRDRKRCHSLLPVGADQFNGLPPRMANGKRDMGSFSTMPPNGEPVFNGPNFMSNGMITNQFGAPPSTAFRPNQPGARGNAALSRPVFGILGPKVDGAVLMRAARFPFANHPSRVNRMVNPEPPNIDTFGTRDAVGSGNPGLTKKANTYGRSNSDSAQLGAEYPDDAISVGKESPIKLPFSGYAFRARYRDLDKPDQMYSSFAAQGHLAEVDEIDYDDLLQQTLRSKANTFKR